MGLPELTELPELPPDELPALLPVPLELPEPPEPPELPGLPPSAVLSALLLHPRTRRALRSRACVGARFRWYIDHFSG
jgi:hypothetical protein